MIYIILALAILIVLIAIFKKVRGDVAAVNKSKKYIKLGGFAAILLIALKLPPALFQNLIYLLFSLPFLKNLNPDVKKYNIDNGNLKKITEKEAREILGVKEGATEKEIKTAFNNLIKKNHPDLGGSSYIANQLIEAKNVLLKNVGGSHDGV
jgi:hypothetical protein